MAEVLRRFDQPEDWTPHRLRDISSRITSRYSSGPATVLTISGAKGLVDQEAYFSRRVASKDLSAYYVLRRGDFAYNKSYSSGYPFGVIARLERHDGGVVSPLYICFRITSRRCSPEFLAHAFEAGILDERLNMIAREGSRDHGLLNVRVEEFFDSTIQLPELGVQQCIAEILSTVDEAIEQTEKLIAKHQQIKAGLMHDLFTRGLTPNGRLRPPHTEAPHLYKDSPLGPIPKEWEVKPLKDITARITDGSHQAVETEEDGVVPFLYVSCIRGNQISYETAAKISLSTYDRISAGRKPRPGVILYTAVGSYGYAALLHSNSPLAFQRHIAYIDASSSRAFAPFLAWLLNCPVLRRHADRVAEGNAQKTVTLRELGKYPILMPERGEQEQTAHAIDHAADAIQKLSEDRAKLLEVKRGLMHDLLTGEVEVAMLEEEPS